MKALIQPISNAQTDHHGEGNGKTQAAVIRQLSEEFSGVLLHRRERLSKRPVLQKSFGLLENERLRTISRPPSQSLKSQSLKNLLGRLDRDFDVFVAVGL